ncbi:MAG TPA: hypothetical protein VEV38_03365, partial [Candidatus Eremiobacteraceae bacterium]|nr:hypothetical protein [Candidatus Eremiobacteraceae bacterium]
MIAFVRRCLPAMFSACLLIAPGMAHAADVAASPASLVDPFVGTGDSPTGDTIDDFPGADVPFGMIQWSPDTTSRNEGGGYEYADTAITGFSLTHLSGPGCGAFGDFAFTPVAGMASDPLKTAQDFAHSSEQASPGWYAVTLGKPGVQVELSVSKRTGIGRFTYPAGAPEHILINASSDQAGVTNSAIRAIGPNSIEGSATSGFFCSQPNTFKIYFAAAFDRPIVSSSVWNDGLQTGIDLSFDPSQSSEVTAHVATSYVSAEGARANLAADRFGFDIGQMHAAAESAWDQSLSTIQIDGGSDVER